MTQAGDWRATHAAISEQDLRFREMAINSPEFLDRGKFAALEQNKELLKYRLQPWLTFLGPGKLEEFKHASRGVCRLLRSIPERVFRHDPVKLAEFYGFESPMIAEIIFAPPTGLETMISRGDFIETAEGFKCIEFNFTPNLGGWETTVLVGMHLAVPATAGFIASAGIEVAYSDTMLLFFKHIFEDAERKGIGRDGELNFAFVVDPEFSLDTMQAGLAYLESEIRRALDTLGRSFRCRPIACHYTDLTVSRETVFWGQVRVQAVVELCRATSPAVYRCFKRGSVLLYNGPMDAVLSSKRNVALLSQYAATDAFDAEERALIARHVPWTRLVGRDPVEFEGEEHALPDLLLAQRERFVLKDSRSSGGKGVVLGRFTSPEAWRQTLDLALDSGRWVVQLHQESKPYLYQSGDYGCSIHDVIWGPFIFGDDYAGAILRMQPVADQGAVNLSLHATEGILLEL